MAELMDTLFGPEPEPAEPHVVAGVQWGPYRPKNPAKCDRCVMLLVAAKGDAPAAHSARFRRRTATTDDLLCYPHAQQLREDDGLPKYRVPPA